MRKETKEMVKLTSKEVLLTVFDLVLPFYEATTIYRISAKKLRESRSWERAEFKEKIKYLRRQGSIRNLVEGKEKYIEITPSGLEKIRLMHFDRISIKRTEKWDKKWRVVIFDIPEKHKSSRDILRNKLIQMGFESIQESVYVYPFECTEEISQISYLLSEPGNILIMISEIIQGEDFLIENFYKKGILTTSDLKKG